MRAILRSLEASPRNLFAMLIALIVLAVPAVVYLRHGAGRSTRLAPDEVPRLGPSATTIAPEFTFLAGWRRRRPMRSKPETAWSSSIQDWRATRVFSRASC